MFGLKAILFLTLACKWILVYGGQLQEGITKCNHEVAQAAETNGHQRVKRVAYMDRQFYWDNLRIPYIFYPSFLNNPDKRLMKRVQEAMFEIEAKSCIRFVPKEAQDIDYVVIVDAAEECFSAIGRRGGAQITGVGAGCVGVGNVVHELMHTVGVWHTQARMDRDQHVMVEWDNIEYTKIVNFIRYSEGHLTWFDLPYDYASIMHYGPYQFSRNGLPTIRPLKKRLIGQRSQLSEGDVTLLNKMYPCTGSKGRCRIPGACVHGTCTELSGTMICQCLKGWGGRACEIPCKDSPCDGELTKRSRVKHHVPGKALVLSSVSNSVNGEYVLALQSVTLEISQVIEETRETCVLSVEYSIREQILLHSLKLKAVMGADESTIWSTSLRDDGPMSQNITIGARVNFSLKLEVLLYYSHDDFAVKSLVFSNCKPDPLVRRLYEVRRGSVLTPVPYLSYFPPTYNITWADQTGRLIDSGKYDSKSDAQSEVVICTLNYAARTEHHYFVLL